MRPVTPLAMVRWKCCRQAAASTPVEQALQCQMGVLARLRAAMQPASARVEVEGLPGQCKVANPQHQAHPSLLAAPRCLACRMPQHQLAGWRPEGPVAVLGKPLMVSQVSKVLRLLVRMLSSWQLLRTVRMRMLLRRSPAVATAVEAHTVALRKQPEALAEALTLPKGQ